MSDVSDSPPHTHHPFHLYFDDFKKEAVQAVKDIVRRDGFFRVIRTDEEAGLNLIRRLFERLSQVYQVPVPSVIRASWDYFSASQQQIGLRRLSLISALHEFRHHLQLVGRRQRYSDCEDDAVGWSVSLFKMALPGMFEEAWRNGRIWFMPLWEEREQATVMSRGRRRRQT